MIGIRKNIVRSGFAMQRVLRKLSFKLIGGMVVILMVVHSLTGILTIRGVQRNTLHYTDSIGQAISRTVANACIEPFLLEDYPVLETYANELVHENPLVMQIQYRREDGKVLATTRREHMEDPAYDSEAIRHYTSPIETEADKELLGHVTVDISTRNMRMLFRAHLLRLVAILTVSLVVIVVVLAVYLEQMIIKPVKTLAWYAHRIGIGGFDEAISIRNQDEIGQLAAALDEMKRNLKTSYSAIQEQNEKLVSLDKMKSQFLANMSHEIRTPMNAIVGFSYLLAKEDLTAEQKDEVDVIRESAQNLLYLINDILDFSKIEAGQLAIEMIDCSMGKLLNSIDSMMQAQAHEKSLDFQIMADTDVPAKIHTDPSRLRQCLINLVNNALKFTEQGHVYLRVSLHQDQGQHSVRFDVEDTGIGIEEGRQAAIFESFTQGDGSTTRKYGGTGLGLAVTKQLAGLLGGEVALTSELGKGSTFSLLLPAGLDITRQPLLDRDKDYGDVPGDAPESETTLFSGNVLVAEDVEGNQKLMELMLSKLGLDVTIAGDGLQVIEKALSGSFDLVLMDIQMPHMNGYDATAALKQQGYQVPIVALTANAMKGDDQVCLDAGCDGYLAKPIDHRELQKVVARYLPVQPEEVDQHSDSTVSSEPESAGPAPSSASGLRDIIDWDQLIDRLGDEETVREIMPIYIQDTAKHFEQLSDAVAMSDCAGIASHAHALKGVGRNLSVDQLADLAGQMERAGRDNDPESCTLLFGSLSRETKKVLDILAACDWSGNAEII